MESTIKFEHGETACAIKPGKFCRFAGVTHFGTRSVCMLFNNETLRDDSEPVGWVKRCKQCLDEFGVKK